jgi:hypothetical protein
MPGSQHLLEPAAARQLLLVRAVDEADAQDKLISVAERELADAEALRAGGATFDPLTFLQARARRLAVLIDSRLPRLAALQDAEPWRQGFAWGLPLAACLLGVALDRIDNPRQVNMLSPPLLAVLLWNLLVYAGLLAGRWLPRDWLPASPVAGLQRRMAGLRVPRRGGSVRSDAAQRFHQLWFSATARQQGWWWRQVLHATAAGWAIGVAISIVVGGLVREYRVGWESTLLDAPQVHAFLRALFAPVVALLPFDSFSVGEIERMRFGSGAAVGVAEARHWLWMYLSLLALLVVLPRAALALWARWRGRREGGQVMVDLADPYFTRVLGRARMAQAMQLLARQVLRAAREAEPVAGGALSLRQLVSASERDAMLQARESAAGALLARLHAAQRETMRAWLALYGLPPDAAAAWERQLDAGHFRLQQPVDSPQASMAGAASGAAMGAGIDLMTGGLTLGAAALLGALVGGAAAYTAAHRKNRTAPTGAAQIQPDDQVLRQLVEAGLVLYFAVVRGQQGLQEQERIAAAVAHAQAELDDLWLQAREGQGEDVALERRAASLLREIALQSGAEGDAGLRTSPACPA